MYQRPGTQLGIVQSDVLAFVARVQSDQTLKPIAKKTKMVFPLYNEEIRRTGIADFDELTDRRVAIGREGSGTYLTARLLFKVSEVQPQEMVPIDTDQALAELKAGSIDAMFYVASHPVKLFTEGVAAADNLVLVPITNKSITEFYPRAEIPAGTYAWQAAPVKHGGGKGRPDLVRFPPEGLRCHQAVRADRVRQPALAGAERSPEVEGGRRRRAPQGLGAVRLRGALSPEAGRHLRGDTQAVEPQSGDGRHQGSAGRIDG